MNTPVIFKELMPEERKLYHAIEMAVIKWSIEGHQPAGVLTREIMGIIKDKLWEK